jgi:tRNA modification GTPase
MSQPIAAIATAQAPGAIGVVRISGDGAADIAARIFAPFSGRSLTESKGYRAHFGELTDGAGAFDTGIATVFRAPKSYTGEDVVEISCHGGLYMTRRLLRAALDQGAALAQPGEFTRRAFLNGKMSLTSAEAVMELIGAQGALAASAAKAASEGALQRKITGVRAQLTDAAAHLTAWADFPDEEVPEVTESELEERLTAAHGALDRLLRQFEAGRVLREGVETVILGRPNVGKSTLMNVLSGCERSIVTDVPGTTRDIVEESVRLGELVLRLADTAGLRETDDPVERIGVDRARRRLNTAGLVLAVFDGASPLDEADRRLIDEIRNRPAVAIINKSDLPEKIDTKYILERIQHTVKLSAAENQGTDALAAAVTDVLGTSQLNPDEGMLFTERQRQAAARAAEAVAEALDALHGGLTFDAITVSVETAIGALTELTGESVSESVVDAVFAQFCVGK